MLQCPIRTYFEFDFVEDHFLGQDTMQQKHTQKLAKFLDYVLGRNPDEFGLVPDEQGYVKIKELLKALNQEEGWRHLRLANINEAD